MNPLEHWEWKPPSFLKPIPPDTVEIWALPHHEFEPRQEQWTPIASKSEIQFAERHKNPRRRLAFLLGSALCRFLLAKRLKTSPADIRILIEKGGKPRAANPDAPSFNISHSRGLTVVAFSRSYQRVGCDVENTTRKVQFDHFTDRFYHPAEQAYIRASGDIDTDRFFTIWTRKEGVLKAHGMGIRTQLNAINTLLPAEVGGEQFHARTGSYDKTYRITLAAETPILHIQHIALTWNHFGPLQQS